MHFLVFREVFLFTTFLALQLVSFLSCDSCVGKPKVTFICFLSFRAVLVDYVLESSTIAAPRPIVDWSTAINFQTLMVAFPIKRKIEYRPTATGKGLNQAPIIKKSNHVRVFGNTLQNWMN